MATVYPKKVTVNFSVSFAVPGLDGILKAEVDGRESDDTIAQNKRGKNKKTSFVPGDTVQCLVFCGPYVKVVESIPSLGSFNAVGVDGGKNGKAGAEEVDQEEVLTFQSPDGLSQTLGYPTDKINELKWFGRTMGYTFDPETNTITATTTKSRDIAVCRVKYTSYAALVPLSHAKLTEPEYEIAVLVIGDYDPTTVTP
jgi:hypothetical protein